MALLLIRTVWHRLMGTTRLGGLDFFSDTGSTTPFKQDDRADKYSFAAAKEASKLRARVFLPGKL
jgi:hypothetical protein